MPRPGASDGVGTTSATAAIRVADAMLPTGSGAKGAAP